MRWPKTVDRSKETFFEALLRGLSYAFGWTCASYMFTRIVYWEIVSILIIVPVMFYGLRILIAIVKSKMHATGR